MAENFEGDGDEKKLKHHVLKAETGRYVLTGFPVSLWITGNFSEAWYEDVEREASLSDNIHARRREILFSVCFLETYLFEWTRDIVGLGNINDYFPYEKPHKRDPTIKRYMRGLKENWRALPKELFDEGKIRADPKLKIENLKLLIAYRNDLVHVHVSRPQSSSQPSELNPRTSPADIERLSPGWARDIAKNLVLDLHKVLGTTPPTYL